MRHATSRLGILAITCAVSALAVAQGPVSAGWTYQGQLKDSGAPANANYEMRFVLYDAASGGSRVGPTLRFDGNQGNPPRVAVVDGLFTVELDFGSGIFTGDALWLQVAVRLNRIDPYTALEPLQPLTAAPYALYALNGPGSGGHWDLNGTNIFNNNSGNVGIGTSAPQTALEIQSFDGPEAQTLRVTARAGRTGGQLHLKNASGLGTYGAVKFLDNNNTTLASVSYSNPPFGNPGLFLNTNVTGGSIKLDGVTGNVAIGSIGTGSPDEKLHVVGGATTAIFGTTSATSGEYGVQGESLSTSGGSGVFGRGRYGVSGFANTLNGFGGVFSGAGGFGSGPSLWVTGDALVGAGLRIGSTGVFDPATVKLHVENGEDVSPEGGGFVVIGDFGRLNIGIDGNEIMARNNGAVSTLFLNHNGGDVRIGQNGGSTTVYVPVLAITGADVAERFAISGTLDEAQPGTVMEIDPHNAGKLRMARGAYTRRVAGVVSGAGDIPTGAILGNLPGFEDAPPIALSGRVWVKCDASQTAIEPGDLLTTSATPGHAMAVRDFTRSPGATLGKAMTPLAKGETGLVLVLVNLQ